MRQRRWKLPLQNEQVYWSITVSDYGRTELRRISSHTHSKSSRLVGLVAMAAIFPLAGCLVVLRPSVGAALAAFGAAAIAVAGPLRRHSGLLVGLLVVGYCNGIPFVDTFNIKVGGVLVRDYFVAALMLLGAWLWITDRQPLGRTFRMLLRALAFYLVTWVFSVAFAALTVGTLSGSMLFGRDMLVLLATFPVAVACRDEGQARAFRSVIVSAGILYCIGLVLLVFAGVQTALVHVDALNREPGALRVYTQMEYLSTASLLLAIGAWLYAHQKRQQTKWILAVVILGLGFLISFVRANYIAVAAGLFVGGIAYFTTGGMRLAANRVVAICFGFAATVTGAVLFGTRSSSGVLASVGRRFASIATDTTAGSGTFGYRVSLYRDMLAILDHSWATGLGFIHPRDRSFPSLPHGTIRDNDTGILAVLMTQGILGILAIGFLVYVVLRASILLLRSGRSSEQQVGWSCMAYLVVSLASAFSLLYLSGSNGLAATAAMVGISVGLADSLERDRSRTREAGQQSTTHAFRTPITSRGGK